MKNVDILVKQINLALEGNSDSEIAITLKELNQILVNVAAFTSDAQGLVPLLLEDKKKGINCSHTPESQRNNCHPQGITSSVNSEMPNINILITQLQGVMREAQSVLEGLKNNPLIKNGVSGKVENDSSSPKLREDNF